MKSIYKISRSFEKEEYLFKEAQKVHHVQKSQNPLQPPKYDPQEVASQILDAFSKIDPSNERLIQLKEQADQKIMTDGQIQLLKSEVGKELPILIQSIKTISILLPRLP